jgi:hypothetical protein
MEEDIFAMKNEVMEPGIVLRMAFIFKRSDVVFDVGILGILHVIVGEVMSVINLGINGRIKVGIGTVDILDGELESVINAGKLAI